MHGTLITITRDGNDGGKYPLVKQHCFIGSSDSCDIQIKNSSVSEKHCLVAAPIHGYVTLQNLNKDNGTFVNGIAVGENSYHLKHKDIVTVADRSFRWEYPESSKQMILEIMDVSSVLRKRKYDCLLPDRLVAVVSPQPHGSNYNEQMTKRRRTVIGSENLQNAFPLPAVTKKSSKVFPNKRLSFPATVLRSVNRKKKQSFIRQTVLPPNSKKFVVEDATQVNFGNCSTSKRVSGNATIISSSKKTLKKKIPYALNKSADKRILASDIQQSSVSNVKSASRILSGTSCKIPTLASDSLKKSEKLISPRNNASASSSKNSKPKFILKKSKLDSALKKINKTKLTPPAKHLVNKSSSTVMSSNSKIPIRNKKVGLTMSGSFRITSGKKQSCDLKNRAPKSIKKRDKTDYEKQSTSMEILSPLAKELTPSPCKKKRKSQRKKSSTSFISESKSEQSSLKKTQHKIHDGFINLSAKNKTKSFPQSMPVSISQSSSALLSVSLEEKHLTKSSRKSSNRTMLHELNSSHKELPNENTNSYVDIMSPRDSCNLELQLINYDLEKSIPNRSVTINTRKSGRRGSSLKSHFDMLDTSKKLSPKKENEQSRNQTHVSQGEMDDQSRIGSLSVSNNSVVLSEADKFTPKRGSLRSRNQTPVSHSEMDDQSRIGSSSVSNNFVLLSEPDKFTPKKGNLRSRNQTPINQGEMDAQSRRGSSSMSNNSVILSEGSKLTLKRGNLRSRNQTPVSQDQMDFRNSVSNNSVVLSEADKFTPKRGSLRSRNQTPVSHSEMDDQSRIGSSSVSNKFVLLSEPDKFTPKKGNLRSRNQTPINQGEMDAQSRRGSSSMSNNSVILSEGSKLTPKRGNLRSRNQTPVSQDQMDFRNSVSNNSVLLSVAYKFTPKRESLRSRNQTPVSHSEMDDHSRIGSSSLSNNFVLLSEPDKFTPKKGNLQSRNQTPINQGEMDAQSRRGSSSMSNNSVILSKGNKLTPKRGNLRSRNQTPVSQDQMDFRNSVSNNSVLLSVACKFTPKRESLRSRNRTPLSHSEMDDHSRIGSSSLSNNFVLLSDKYTPKKGNLRSRNQTPVNEDEMVAQSRRGLSSMSNNSVILSKGNKLTPKRGNLRSRNQTPVNHSAIDAQSRGDSSFIFNDSVILPAVHKFTPKRRNLTTRNQTPVSQGEVNAHSRRGTSSISNDSVILLEAQKFTPERRNLQSRNQTPVNQSEINAQSRRGSSLISNHSVIFPETDKFTPKVKNLQSRNQTPVSLNEVNVWSRSSSISSNSFILTEANKFTPKRKNLCSTNNTPVGQSGIDIHPLKGALSNKRKSKLSQSVSEQFESDVTNEFIDKMSISVNNIQSTEKNLCKQGRRKSFSFLDESPPSIMSSSLMTTFATDLETSDQASQNLLFNETVKSDTASPPIYENVTLRKKRKNLDCCVTAKKLTSQRRSVNSKITVPVSDSKGVVTRKNFRATKDFERKSLPLHFHQNPLINQFENTAVEKRASFLSHKTVAAKRHSSIEPIDSVSVNFANTSDMSVSYHNDFKGIRSISKGLPSSFQSIQSSKKRGSTSKEKGNNFDSALNLTNSYKVSPSPRFKSASRRSITSKFFEKSVSPQNTTQKNQVSGLSDVMSEESILVTSPSNSVSVGLPVQEMSARKARSARKHFPEVDTSISKSKHSTEYKAEKAAKRLKSETPKSPDKKKMAALLVCHLKGRSSVKKKPLYSDIVKSKPVMRRLVKPTAMSSHIVHKQKLRMKSNSHQVTDNCNEKPHSSASAKKTIKLSDSSENIKTTDIDQKNEFSVNLHGRQPRKSVLMSAQKSSKKNLKVNFQLTSNQLSTKQDTSFSLRSSSASKSSSNRKDSSCFIVKPSRKFLEALELSSDSTKPDSPDNSQKIRKSARKRKLCYQLADSQDTSAVSNITPRSKKHTSQKRSSDSLELSGLVKNLLPFKNENAKRNVKFQQESFDSNKSRSLRNSTLLNSSLESLGKSEDSDSNNFKTPDGSVVDSEGSGQSCKLQFATPTDTSQRSYASCALYDSFVTLDLLNSVKKSDKKRQGQKLESLESRSTESSVTKRAKKSVSFVEKSENLSNSMFDCTTEQTQTNISKSIITSPLSTGSNKKKSISSDSFNIRKVETVFSSPKSPATSYLNVTGVKRVLRTPKSPKSSYLDVKGVKRLIRTPKSPKSTYLDVEGVKRLIRTPKSPKSSYLDVEGVKRLIRTPKSPKSSYLDVEGVKRLLRTPRSPKSNYFNVEGVKRIFDTPEKPGTSYTDVNIKKCDTPNYTKTPNSPGSPNFRGTVENTKSFSKTPEITELELNSIANSLPRARPSRNSVLSGGLVASSEKSISKSPRRSREFKAEVLLPCVSYNEKNIHDVSFDEQLVNLSNCVSDFSVLQTPSNISTSVFVSPLSGNSSKQQTSDVLDIISDKKVTPKNRKSNHLDVKGVKRLIRTPRKSNSAEIEGIKQIFQVSPVPDYTDVIGVKRLFGEDEKRSYLDVTGVRNALKDVQSPSVTGVNLLFSSTNLPSSYVKENSDELEHKLNSPKGTTTRLQQKSSITSPESQTMFNNSDVNSVKLEPTCFSGVSDSGSKHTSLSTRSKKQNKHFKNEVQSVCSEILPKNLKRITRNNARESQSASRHTSMDELVESNVSNQNLTNASPNGKTNPKKTQKFLQIISLESKVNGSNISPLRTRSGKTTAVKTLKSYDVKLEKKKIANESLQKSKRKVLEEKEPESVICTSFPIIKEKRGRNVKNSSTVLENKSSHLKKKAVLESSSASNSNTEKDVVDTKSVKNTREKRNAVKRKLKPDPQQISEVKKSTPELSVVRKSKRIKGERPSFGDILSKDLKTSNGRPSLIINKKKVQFKPTVDMFIISPRIDSINSIAWAESDIGSEQKKRERKGRVTKKEDSSALPEDTTVKVKNPRKRALSKKSVKPESPEKEKKVTSGKQKNTSPVAKGKVRIMSHKKTTAHSSTFQEEPKVKTRRKNAGANEQIGLSAMVEENTGENKKEKRARKKIIDEKSGADSPAISLRTRSVKKNK